MSSRHIVGFFRIEDRRSIPRSYFESLIGSDDYQYLTDPVDLLACEKYVDLALFGFQLKAGLSVVTGVVVGYQGSNAQEVIDVVYEACSQAFSLFEN